jgi:hypothetical protein
MVAAVATPDPLDVPAPRSLRDGGAAGASDEDGRARRRRPSMATIALLLIGALLGAGSTLAWTVRPTARVVTGVVGAIDDRATAILLDEPADLREVGLGITGVMWRDRSDAGPDDGWQRTLSATGNPTCLTPDDVGATVRLGLVTDPGGADRPPSEVIAWLECR